MSGLAFLFPGQGSQKVGMGAGLGGADADRLRTHLEVGSAAAGLDLPRLCAHGPMERLTRTDAAQPSLFAVSLTLAEIAAELGLRPMAVAGHSLGEYTAAVASGALTAADGMRLVAGRGRVMARAQAQRPGAMAAVLGLSAARVVALCEEVRGPLDLAPANLNAPDQVVVSGDAAAVDALVDAVATGRRRGVRAVRLPVGAAFHSAMMQPAREHLASAMTTVVLRDPDVPLVANVTGRAVRSADAVRAALVEQITAPVRWVDCVRTLVASGCTTFVELGPGRVLGGLVRRIAPQAAVVCADSRAKLAALA
jgi:[acyl-carrier-protein] S-malonyltransferase